MAEIGLGLAALGRPAYINLGHDGDLEGVTAPQALEARCHEVLDAAAKAGIRYLDCARSYGRSEAFLGRWLRGRAVEPGACRVASKWGYRYTANWDPDAEVHEVKDHSVEHLSKQHAESSEHLWEYLDIYQIHSATLETGVLEDRAVLGTLGVLRDERGWEIGLSVSGPAQAEVIDRALEVEISGAPLFRTVQATFNLLERSAGPALERAHAAGRRVVIKEGMANGRLARPEAGELPEPLARSLKALARQLGVGFDAIALGALLAQPFVSVALSGAASVSQLQSNLRGRELPPDELRSLWLELEGQPASAYWSHRKALPWV